MTTIQSTIPYADGRPANGRVVVSWPPFQVNGVAVAGGQQAWDIVNGVLSVALYANINAQPLGMYYTAAYELDEGARYEEYWVLPDLNTVTLGQVQITFPVTPSAMINATQLTSSGAQNGQILGWNGSRWVPMWATGYSVTTVFGRTGNILAQTGDYNVSQVTGALADPTTTKGDLIVRGASIMRLPVGANGQVLTADSTQASGLKWAAGAGAVSSVFGRTGNVVAANGDYTASEVTNAVDTTQTYADPVWITSLSWSKITGAPAAPVTSVFGRTGAVAATAGDYTAAQVTNAVSALGSYADPAWITSLGWGKITGAPVFLTDPTTTQGDLIVRGASVLIRLGISATDGQVLTVDSTQPGKIKWAAPSGGGGGAVSSVFGRIGAVVAVSGDYTAAMVTNAVDATQVYANPAWITSLAWSKITGAPATGVSSVFTRTGAVVAAIGDYTAAQVTNAVDSTGSYANPTWITSLAWSKITGAPATGVSSVFTRTGAVVAAAGDYTAAQVTNAVDSTGSYANPTWITSLAWSKITGAPATGVSSVFTRTGAVVAVTGDYTAAQVTNAVDSTQAYANPAWITSLAWSKITGAPAGGSQTPWTSNINAATFQLQNAGNIYVGNTGATAPDGLPGWATILAGPITSASTGGEFCACGNVTSGNPGYFSVANYAIAATEKRIATLNGLTDGANNSGAWAFFTASAGTLTERMRVTSAGNVGIGTASPVAKLTVGTGIPASVSLTAIVLNSFGVADTAGKALFLNGSDSPFSGEVEVGAYDYVASGFIPLHLNGSKIIMGDSSRGAALVGIGGIPTDLLTMFGGDLVINRASSQSSNGPRTYGSADGCRFAVYQDNNNSFARMLDIVSLGSAGGSPSVIRFLTNPTGGSPLERMRLDMNGNVFIPGLPSANPGSGSKGLWYDPADSNRVKFAS